MRFYPYSSRVFPLNHEKSQEEPEEEEHCRKNCDRNQDPLAALFLLQYGPDSDAFLAAKDPQKKRSDVGISGTDRRFVRASAGRYTTIAFAPTA